MVRVLGGGSLELFRRSGDDLIDRWDGRRLIRAVPVGDTWTPLVAVAGETVGAPHFAVAGFESAHMEAIRGTVATSKN